ncbi:hemopexin repeat-containing protein [Leptothoe sp. LEGE 181152]|nr:hemopexin repeat-containing protein [Leptothoe sp. LEGE 181152]
MSMISNIPNYADLFGNIDFKAGDESRSVYSPAAYLVDLLQMLDDEFVTDEADEDAVDFHSRRSDIQGIDLDAENTTTLIPYLDIVNEVLEGRVDSTDYETREALEAAVFGVLEGASYPFNMPFSLNSEKVKNHLNHLGITAHELRRLFATTADYTTVAREYLGLSTAEWTALLEPDEVAASSVMAYGYIANYDIELYDSLADVDALPEGGTSLVIAAKIGALYYIRIFDSTGSIIFDQSSDDFSDSTELLSLLAEIFEDISSIDADKTAELLSEIRSSQASVLSNHLISLLSTVTSFMETTDLESQEMLELLYQNLYVDPSDHSAVEAGRGSFYINTGTSNGTGYVTLSDDETTLEWSDGGAVPIEWFDRTSRFVRLAQKTGLSFTDLDHILRHCCQVDSVPTLSADTLVYIAQVVYIHKTLEQPLDTVVAILSEISYVGRTNEDLPQDQFNRIFNLPCVSIDEKYFYITDQTGELPAQYNDTTYHTYTQIDYAEDLFSDDNDTYRQRLRHALGFTETDLINITERLEFEEVADSSLWENTGDAYQWNLLNVLYRISALSNALDVHFLELFILFDLLEQDPFIGRLDSQTHFVYQVPSTQKCFEILMAPVNSDTHSISDQLWLFESLMALTKWMKEFGYSPEMLWAIVNGAPMTDQAEETQNAQDLALYNTLLQSFQAKEMQPDTLADALGDQRASHFAFNLMQQRQEGMSGDMPGDMEKSSYRCKSGAHKKRNRYKNHSKKLGMHHMPSMAHGTLSMLSAYPESGMHPKAAKGYHRHLLMAYEPRKIQALTEEFIQQLAVIHDYEFVDLQFGGKLHEKIVKNLINHQVIDGSGKLLTQDWIDGQLPAVENFQLEFDFSEIRQDVFEIIHGVYQEEMAGQLDENDEIQVQVFKSDFEGLGLSVAETRELYDNLIYNDYIDEQGFVTDVAMFSHADGVDELFLDADLAELTDQVHHLLQQQLDKFAASKIQINAQMFAELDLDPNALKDLIRNLQMNRYIDKHMFVVDKMRIVDEGPRMTGLALQFYPHREAISKVLHNAIVADQATWLQLDQNELAKLAAKTVSRWVHEDLQEDGYLNGNQLQSGAGAFFKQEDNRESFGLRNYFDDSQNAIAFDHLASIVTYADQYRLQDEKLTALEFNADEIEALKHNLTDIDVLDEQDLLQADRIPFFLVPENAAAFHLPGFEDYNLEVFFQIHDIAKAINGTVKAVDQALKAHTDEQQSAIIEQLQGVLGINPDAVKALSQAVFKTENNLHFAWLKPLLEDANALGQLDELPNDMHYAQAVKRIRQFALLIKQQQLDIHEITLALEDQELVAKFPEDLILPDNPDSGSPITSVDALLETDEFIYLFKDDYYWIYLAKDYTLIDKKEIDLDSEDDQDLVDLQKDDEALQKRLKEDPIRQLFDEEEELNQVDAAFIDRHGTWVIISDASHYVRYADGDSWDKRDNTFGQVDNDFDNLEMIDSAYVDSEGRLFLFANDKYVRYSDIGSTLTSSLTVDQGYPKSIAEDWNSENLAIQLPAEYGEDLGPMFDGGDQYSYAFLGNTYVSSEDGQVRPAAEKWGHREHNFGHPSQLNAALACQGNYYLFLDNKIAKYVGSIELANLQPEDSYPKGIHQEFSGLPDEFTAGIDAALYGWDGTIYLFRDDEYVSIDPSTNTVNEVTDTTGEVTLAQVTREQWGKVANDIADSGTVDAAFVGLDGYTYLFSGEQYVRYSGHDYTQVDDGFPRDIAEDWEGLTTVTAAFVLGNKTYLFGTKTTETTETTEVTEAEIGTTTTTETVDGVTTTTITISADGTTTTTTTTENVYVRYSTLHKEEDDYLEVDEEDPNARVIETVLANRPDVDEIEVFPALVNDDFWSLPESVTNGATDFQIDAVMNGPEGKVYLFYLSAEDGLYYYIEHNYSNRWWSEPKVLSDQWDRNVNGLADERVVAALMGTDGKTYLFYGSKFLRFSDAELRNIDYGYPRLTHKVWGKVRNNIERTGKVDAALIVESRWEEQDKNGQLVDMTANHTYLFSGDQFFRYVNSDYSTVEQGYPRSIHRLKDEPRFRGLQVAFPEGIDAAFADQRQVYLFKGDSFHVVIGDEDNYKQYDNDAFADVQAALQERGENYILSGDTWYQTSHLEARTLTQTEATPRTVQRVESLLESDAQAMTDVSAILHGSDGKSYVFAGDKYYDVELEQSFTIADVWGRSRNPIYDQETIDAAFVGRDGVTYVFSGEWFVQYDADTSDYTASTVTYPPRRISDKWRGLNNVALAYVWKEDTYLFERPDMDGNFRYLHYIKDSYDQPVPLYEGDFSLWDMPEEYQEEGFDAIDAIFVHEENLIFISDQKFLSFNLDTENWGFPQPLELLYPEVPFNKTDFQTLKSGFVGNDSTVYLFSQERYAAFDDNDDDWTVVTDIKDAWGRQKNIFDSDNRKSHWLDAAWVNPSDRTTYLFAGDSYVRYSGDDYRYVDEGYPKKIATYLRDEPAFAFMTKEFQQHLDQLEADYDGETPFFDGLMDNGRCLYFFTNNTVFTGSPNKYVAYDIDGLGHIDNNFTLGGYIDAAFVAAVDDTEKQMTYLFSGEQYIRYTVEQTGDTPYRGDCYRYVDEGYPKIIGESLAEELGLDSLPEDYRNGIDAAFYLATDASELGLVLFNERNYHHVTDLQTDSAAGTEGEVNAIWGNLDNTFTSESGTQTVDGAYVDGEGKLLVFKDQQFVCYSDTANLFALNPYDEPRYVDMEYPRDINETWPQLDDTILTDSGVSTVFKFEDEIYFHTGEKFVTHNLDLSDHDAEKPVQVLAYRWGEWSDYLLSDIHAITRFKDLGQRFTGGNLTLTELISGAKGKVKEPYMHFAAIFNFEKEDVRWVKQRNAFLADPVNVMEEDFHLELVLRLYDILATTQRMRADVSELYNNVWRPLYDSDYWSNGQPDVSRAATGAYDVLVSVDCDNNYATLVKQITNEVNTLKRDALVPYVIANDDEITTTRQLYQKLLIDIQMDSCAETSRIKEATAAVQLYLHRYFMNLEEVTLEGDDTSDQEALKANLKERWEWLQNYRVWEANRKVFLYPENYIRPELRDADVKSAAFKALESSLTQGKLTDELIEEAYVTYLDSFTEVSELTIAGGYVYDDTSSDTNNKVLVLFGHTRTDPMRYFYRFATFVGGESSAIIWDPWEELNISIEVDHVKPVYAFNRVFVFWAVIEESAEDPSSAVVTTSGSDSNQTVSSQGNSQKEIKIYYSFYNLNKRWSQPQLLQTSFEETSYTTTLTLNDTAHTLTDLKTSLYISDADIFVENSSKLSDDDYENIYISVRYYLSDTYDDSSPAGPYYRAYNLTPELYSQEAATRSIENRGQELFAQLFPEESSIEEDKVVMLSYSDDSIDGPWFAYNYNGSGFLVKPNETALSDDIGLKAMSSDAHLSNITSETSINAAVQVFDDDDIYYFLDDGTYMAVSVDGDISEGPQAISSRWGIRAIEIDDSITIDSAYIAADGSAYVILEGAMYKYDGSSFSTLTIVSELSETITDLPDSWSTVDAAFTYGDVTFWFNNSDGSILRSDSTDSNTVSFVDSFGVSLEEQDDDSSIIEIDQIDAALIGTGTVGTEGKLYLFCGTQYLRYSVDSDTNEFSSTPDADYPKTLADNDEGLPQWTQVDAGFTFTDSAENDITYLFNNENHVYYQSNATSSEPSTTIGLWGAVESTNLNSEERVDAAYVADNCLYLILNTEDSFGSTKTEYYRYSLSDDTVPQYIDSDYPKTYSSLSSDDISKVASSCARKIEIVYDELDDLDVDLEEILTQLSTIQDTFENAGDMADFETAVINIENVVADLTDLTTNGSTLLTTMESEIANLSSLSTSLEKFITNSRLGDEIDAAFVLEDDNDDDDDSNDSYCVYLFSGTNYYRLKNLSETSQLDTPLSISGSWGNIPADIRSAGITAAYNYTNSDVSKLYLIQDSYYLAYTDALPYEIDTVKYEVIRLTSSTAEQLNQILFAGEISDFLKMSTQEINESPAISFDDSSPNNIQMSSTWFNTEPVNSHLDFNSANGLYYWEIFFHIPFLIAQTLNTDQQFEYAKKWYEYIFDPTAISDYWKFLPFLAVDPDALLTTLTNDLDAFEALTSTDTVATARTALTNLDSMLAGYQKVFLGQEDLDTYEDASGTDLSTIATWEYVTDLESAINNLATTADELLATWQSEMLEVVAIIKILDSRLELMRNYSAQLAEYLDDPFDPHAIAALRPIAYRKAIVMRYIDNLLDWGDMLFRQYTRESINEARMLYILAYDILGEKPKNMGRVVLESTKNYSDFYTDQDGNSVDPNEAYDFLIDLENTVTDGVVDYEQSLSFAATQFDTITNPYFYLPENELFTEYWTRVEDRLGKIRACLNIDGVAQPLPLFQPPIDPMALVSAVAGSGGMAAAAAMAAGAATVPDYRFSSLMAKARELVTKLNGFSDALLSALEKKDAEELSLLQNKQESILLDLTTLLKEEAIQEAEQSLLNLQETKLGAEQQETHYADLIDEGYLPEELTQLSMMGIAATLHGVTALSKYMSGLSYIVPQFTAGPFSFGVTTGGEDIGSMLAQFGEAIQSGAEALSMGGEVAGVAAQFKRSAQDWALQKMMATSEIQQLEYQIQSQQHQLAIAKQEKIIHEKDIENHHAIADFMKNKFSTAQLYSWMSGKISGLYFQTYKLAHDYAKQAEQAFVFEKGVAASQVNYINGMYWDSQRKGLLSGNSLGHDLDRLEKAYRETDSRRLEITKSISLLELDPMALLNLKTKGFCQFRLSEELFDYDFPGHYNRQIKTVSLAFDVGEGQQVNATLSQLSSKLVMAADIKAVKHLIDPSNEATPNVRVNWRANQQVALSHVDQYTENNGMFELNFGDERYLPFEGTGAVSNWRLELNGMKGSYNPADLLDVTVKLRYTAKQGGSRFANEVKGVLKPYHATSFFDLAYNFPDQWAALTSGDVDKAEITFTRDMFPNMSSSKIIGLFMHYEYADDQGGAIFTINDDLQVPNNTYLQPHTINVGQNGSSWTFMLKGDGSTLKNAEMVLVYKAKV